MARAAVFTDRLRHLGRMGTVRPTRRALVAFLVGLPLAALPALAELGRGPGPVTWPWLAFVGLAVALLAVDASKVPARSDLSWELSVPRVLPVGRSTEAAVELTVAGAEPGAGGLVDRLPGFGPPPLRAILDVSARLEAPPEVGGLLTRGHDGAGRARLVFPLVPRRRGRVQLERLWLALPGPLGLVERIHRIDGDDLGGVRLEARSDLARVQRAALSFADRRSFLAGLKIERFAGDGTEFEALREFQPGFDLRSIDWKASARHRNLLCREMRAERNHQVVLALDTGRLMGEPLARSGAGPSEPMPRLDHAIHAALLIGYVAWKSGDRVGLFAFDQEPRLWVPPRSGPGAFPVLHARTAGIDYGNSETNFTRGLTTLATHLSRRSLVIVLTELVDSITAELMVDNLSHLARRHLVVLAALRDPGLARRSRQVPESLLDVQRALVADSLLAEREVVLRRLDRQGLATLDVAPEELEPRLLERYLEIKRREMVA